MTKPGDFLLGVQDFFAVLMPGAVATWIASHYVPRTWAGVLDLSAGPSPSGEVLRWTVFLFVAYTLGHFVFMASSRLDGSYDRWRKRTKPKEKDLAFDAADKLRKRLHPELDGADFTTLKWAKSYVQVHAPGARVEIDRFEAASKFFRGMVVVALVLAAHFVLRERAFALAAASLALAWLSFHRYCDQRWKTTELSYGTALIVHEGQARK
jgi:hypothetical protein